MLLLVMMTIYKDLYEKYGGRIKFLSNEHFICFNFHQTSSDQREISADQRESSAVQRESSSGQIALVIKQSSSDLRESSNDQRGSFSDQTKRIYQSWDIYQI